MDYTATDMGTDTTMHWMCDSVKDGGTSLSSRARVSSIQGKASAPVVNKGSTIENKMLQVCPHGQQKVTSIKSLKTHQGRKKCLEKKGPIGHIDEYFLEVS